MGFEILIAILILAGWGIYYIGKACWNYPKQKREISNLHSVIKEKDKELFSLEERCNKLKDLLCSSSPFSLSATMFSDVYVCTYESAEYYLKHKYRPAYKAAEDVRALRLRAKSDIAKYKEMSYKYEFLLKSFPELKKYIDDEEALLSLDKSVSYDDFKENRDCSRDYLSQEEWNKLDVNSRNQLALDRYKKKKKSSWVVGIEYEMYIDYLLRNSGYKTIPNGSLNGLEDLGRDIIAFKTNNKGENIVYIIQCKNWASDKEIHENVVCQLFGTAVEYTVRHKGELFTKVCPVIYTTAPLSDMANEFAKILKVVVRVVKCGEYPMIKCNISADGRKIYHLPFDQQYYRTEIKKPGEFYAWTVKEAVDAGFRRAFRYNNNDKIK